MARMGPDSRYLRNGEIYVDQRDSDQKWNYQPPTINPDPTDLIELVLPQEAWRPDLIAARVYNGRHFLAWVIMRANKFFHVRQIIPGLAVRIPSLARLEGNII